MLQKLLNNEIAIHCQSEYQAKYCLQIIYNNTLTRQWSGDISILSKTYWSIYNNNTCYLYKVTNKGNQLCYDDINDVELNNILIINANVFIYFYEMQEQMNGNPLYNKDRYINQLRQKSCLSVGCEVK